MDASSHPNPNEIPTPVDKSIMQNVFDIEHSTVTNYRPPSTRIPNKKIDYVYNPSDGSVLLDHKGRPISVDKLLATKPLRGELSTRPGPGNKKLTYISGEGVSRTLNDIFGFDGWNLDITKVQREECVQMNSKYHIVYTAQVRLTHKASGAYKEDCGAGDAVDRSFGTAVAHALKASITDAMKRAARHFGDKLGNSLYQGNFSMNKAPTTLKDALDKYDIERANTKFGFPKDQVYKNTGVENIPPSSVEHTYKTTCVSTNVPQSSGQKQQYSAAPVPTNHSNDHAQKLASNEVSRTHDTTSYSTNYNPPPTANDALRNSVLFSSSSSSSLQQQGGHNSKRPSDLGLHQPNQGNLANKKQRTSVNNPYGAGTKHGLNTSGMR